MEKKYCCGEEPRERDDNAPKDDKRCPHCGKPYYDGFARDDEEEEEEFGD